MALSVELDNLKNSLSCVTYNGAQHTHVLIEENEPAASLTKVTLHAPPGDWFSFSPDDGRKCKRLDKKSNLIVMSPLLAIGVHDHHCACDAVVLVRREEKLTVLYIDLKSGRPNAYSKQFKSTRQFVRYALALLTEFYAQKLPIVEERFIILHGGKGPLLNKTTTVPKVEAIGKTTPENAYKRHVPDKARLHLKELLE
jgi:hypothetical protein